MAQMKQVVGIPMSRVDGRLKVTGGARYAAEFQVKDVSYGVLVLSTVAKGKITKIETEAAQKAPGVLAVISHVNAGKVKMPDSATALVDPDIGSPLQPFQDENVHYHGQPVAVLVADTFVRAIHAATLVRASYDEAKAVLDFEAAASEHFTPHRMETDRGTEKTPDYHRGDAEKALKDAPVKVEATY